MTTNDAMNKALRTANGRGAFTVDETPSWPGKDWLRAEVEAAKLRGTADNPALGELPPVVVAPVVSHGSADGGAGTHSELRSDALDERVDQGLGRRRTGRPRSGPGALRERSTGPRERL